MPQRRGARSCPCWTCLDPDRNGMEPASTTSRLHPAQSRSNYDLGCAKIVWRSFCADSDSPARSAAFLAGSGAEPSSGNDSIDPVAQNVNVSNGVFARLSCQSPWTPAILLGVAF